MKGLGPDTKLAGSLLVMAIVGGAIFPPHGGFKIAAKIGPRFLTALVPNEEVIARNVTENLHKWHIGPLFPTR